MALTYYFSGSLTRDMITYLSNMPGYEPIDVLVSQLDRSSIKKMFQFQDEGLVNKLFIDSGAFSFHTGKAKLDLEEYIEYLNSIDDRITICAQVDTIPGKFGQPKSKKDYEESAKKSWDNYLYMRSKLKSPEKLTPVFHFGENFDALRNILNWRGPNGEKVEYMGLSPANDTDVRIKNRYLNECYDVIKNSTNPNIGTHLYGYTSLPGLPKLPCTSVDSISHRHIAAYNKIYLPKYGIVSITDRARTVSNKSSMSFIQTADEAAKSEVQEYLSKLGTTLEECRESSSMRCAVTMYGIMQYVKDNPYKPENVKKAKRLFNI